MGLTFNINDLEWSNKAKKFSDTDVTITANTYGTKKMFSLTLRNDAHKFFKTGYVQLAVVGDILLMREAEKDVGYRIAQASLYSYRVQISNDHFLHEWGKKHMGDYVLQKDLKQGIAYIERKKVY